MSSKKYTANSKFRASSRQKQNIKEVKTIQWAPGFKPPRERDRLRAIGFEDRCSPCKVYQPDIHFTPIPEPVDDKDWLANNNEEGQSFFQFIGTCPWIQKAKVKGYDDTHNAKESNLGKKYPNGKIYIIEILSEKQNDKNSPQIDTESLRHFVEIYYGITTILLPSLCLKQDTTGDFAISHTDYESLKSSPESANNKAEENRTEFLIHPTYRQNSDGTKVQVRIDTGLSDLKNLMPKDGLFLVGVTMIDLYCDNTDLFTVGIGSCKDRLGIFSFLRYDPSFQQVSEEIWHEYTIDEDKEVGMHDRSKLVLQRSLKTMVHEIGHLFGIKHCIYFMCLMNGSGHIDEDFRQPLHLCPVDLHKVCTLTGIEYMKRYQNLVKYYELKDMPIEASWVTNRLSWLNKL